MRKYKLDEYEMEIEKNFHKFKPLPPEEHKKMEKMLVAAAKAHVKNKKSISLRVSENDLKAIKAKAAKQGLPYQTYINMLIHKDVTGQLNERI